MVTGKDPWDLTEDEEACGVLIAETLAYIRKHITQDKHK